MLEGIVNTLGSLMNWIVSVIGMLFVATRYIMWGIAIVGIPISIILIFANIKRGIKAVLLMIAALCIAISVALVAIPSSLIVILPIVLQANRFVIGGILGLVALAIATLVCFAKGEFPELNLLFNK